MTVIMPIEQIGKIDQYRELESRNEIIRKAVRLFIIEKGVEIYGKYKTND